MNSITLSLLSDHGVFPRRFLATVAAGLALGVSMGDAQIILDDFNDGNDTGWTRANPLAAVGGSTNYNFPGGNTYRIVANASPNPTTFGPARAGAYRGDASYTAFHIEVDLVAWDAALNQDIGILARVSTPGLGTLNGYAWSYETGNKTVYLSRLDNEAPTNIGSVPVELTAGVSYRFIFEGFENQFCGQIFDLSHPELSLATVRATDSSHAEGFGGVFNNSVPAAGTTDSTFDNYASSIGTDVDKDGMTDQWELDHFGDLFWFEDEDFDGDGQTNLEEFIGGSDPANAGSLSGISRVVVAGGEVVVSFPLVAQRNYLLEVSLDLEEWTPQPGAVLSDDGTTASLTLPTGGLSPFFVRVVASVK